MFELIAEKCKDNPERKEIVAEDFKQWVKGGKAETKELREILDEAR